MSLPSAGCNCLPADFTAHRGLILGCRFSRARLPGVSTIPTRNRFRAAHGAFARSCPRWHDKSIGRRGSACVSDDSCLLPSKFLLLLVLRMTGFLVNFGRVGIFGNDTEDRASRRLVLTPCTSMPFLAVQGSDTKFCSFTTFFVVLWSSTEPQLLDGRIEGF